MRHSQRLTAEVIGTAASFRVLDVRVNAVQIPDVIELMEHWIATRSACHFIAFTGMHGITEAQYDPSFKQILELGRPGGGGWHALGVAGPLARFRHAPARLWAGTDGNLLRQHRARLSALFLRRRAGGGGSAGGRNCTQLYGVRSVGTYTPPFRPLTEEEKVEVDRRIQAAAPDVVWVGLSTPKQERWMYEHRARLGVPIMAGVGAAFDFITGAASQSPAWMQENGPRVVLPPHSRAAPPLAPLPRQRVKIRMERLFGAFDPQEIRLTIVLACTKQRYFWDQTG